MEKVILITGSSTGFGFRSAKYLAAQGHTVFASMRLSKSKNAGLANELREFARRENHCLETVEMDVTDNESVDKAVEYVVAQAGRVDVLLNNAGIWGPGILEAFTLEQWQAVFAVNLFGSVRVARAVLPLMRRQKSGLIIQISSLQGRFILPYSGPYVASKFAVEGAMETFRYEVAPHGVEVCLIEPGDFMTEMKVKAVLHQPDDHEREKDYGETVEMVKQMYLIPDASRSGDPQEVVRAISKLIEMTPGKRPIRTIVNNMLPQIEQINQISNQMHEELFPYIGLQNLLTVKVSDVIVQD